MQFKVLAFYLTTLLPLFIVSSVQASPVGLAPRDITLSIRVSLKDTLRRLTYRDR